VFLNGRIKIREAGNRPSFLSESLRTASRVNFPSLSINNNAQIFILLFVHFYPLTFSRNYAILLSESEGIVMKKYFIINLPNSDTIFTKYHKWSEMTRILPYLNREQYKGITISEVNFWNFYKKLLTNRK